jgi:hypothetical protein
MFWETILSLFNGAIHAYFILTVYALFVKPFSWVVLMFVIYNCLVSMIDVYRIWNLTSATESIGAEMNLAKDHVQNYKVSMAFFVLVI